MKRVFLAILITSEVGCAIFGTSTSTASVQFSFDLSSIPGEGQYIGRDINNHGDIVGSLDVILPDWYWPKRMGFVRRGEIVTLIDFPGAEILNGTEAAGINDDGVIVGQFTEAVPGDVILHGFLLEGSQLEQFDVPGSSWTQPADINNHGAIVGRTHNDALPVIGEAFVRTGEDYRVFLPAEVLDYFGVWPHGSNDRGDMIGQVFADWQFQSFAILDGTYSNFTIPASYYTAAEGINNAGQIVGWFCKPDCGSIHGFLMDATGTYQIDAPAEQSYATFLGGINDEGFLVGSVGFHRFPAQELLVASPCPDISETCQQAQRIADPLIDFTVKMSVDIKPGNSRNVINPSARGVVPVAILGSDTFDVGDIQRSSLMFGPSGASPLRAQAVDVNGDGFVDLLVHFKTEAIGITPSSTEVCLTGELLNNRPLRGCDDIQTEPSRGSAFTDTRLSDPSPPSTFSLP